MQEVESYDKTILPSAQQAVETATRGFEMGKFGFIEVLDAQRTLIVARGQYLESLAAATSARAQVEGFMAKSAQPPALAERAKHFLRHTALNKPVPTISRSSNG
jgi:outer membrane protein TolC